MASIEIRQIERPADVGELLDGGRRPPCWAPEWPEIMREGLGHEPYLLAALEEGDWQGSTVAFGCDISAQPGAAVLPRVPQPGADMRRPGKAILRGYLPLCLVASPMFGRFLVSLPYLNSAGVLAADEGTASRLIDRAVELADELDVRYLELRHERRVEHASLTREMNGKVHMRLTLPATADLLWDSLKAKVRNQVRKGREPGFEVAWGGRELLEEFYAVFARNMRDLGTPVFGRRLFRAVVDRMPEQAEFCVVRDRRRPVAAALLIHGRGVSEVPSASALREYNSANVNMLMYWHLLERAIKRGQRVFDFGRSTLGSGTHQFKKQWGAEPQPAVWQYYIRKGDIGDVRPDNAKYGAMIRVWQRLPVWLTRVIGPPIVRGIP